MNDVRIIRKTKTKNFVVLDKQFLQDSSLSWKAKGLLSYLLSLPDEWKIKLEEISQHSSDGYTSFESGIKELKNKNYVKVEPIRKAGKIDYFQYTIYEKPYFSKENLLVENQLVENRSLLNNNINNNTITRYTRNSVRLDKQASLIDLKKDFFGIAAKKFNGIVQNTLSRQVRLQTWANEFRKLKDKYNLTNNQIKELVNWYNKNYKNEYTPKIYKISDLIEKFPRIQDAMKRSSSSSSQQPKIIISKEAKKITSNLLDSLHWPKDAASQLPQVVQQSLDNYKQYLVDREALRERIKNDNKLKPVLSFIEGTDDDDILDSTWYIERKWMKRVNEVITNWKEWNGNMKGCVFTIFHKFFLQEGREMAMTFSGTPERWDEYFAELLKGLK